MVTYFHRKIETSIFHALARGKSVLLLGPRQTGKTTLVLQQLKPDITYSFAHIATRQRYEKNPALLEKEIAEKIKSYSKPPLIFIDEVQKIPAIMDAIQYLIDQKAAQFILSGSSARKLKKGCDINLLPGRVVVFIMTPLMQEELPQLNSLEDCLIYGSLPGVVSVEAPADRDADLYSYVSTYLEEEIRSEALVRRVGDFTRFLELAAGESGKQINFTRLSQTIGVSGATIASYFQILEDCLIASRIDPITESKTKRRLIKSPKYLFFDLGVRRACANEGVKLPQQFLGDLFEQYVGLELIRHALVSQAHEKIYYWRDSAGPEVDYVVDRQGEWIPIEVKWTATPNRSDTKHLEKFLSEYAQAKIAYVICQTPARYLISEQVTAIPWWEIGQLFLAAER